MIPANTPLLYEVELIDIEEKIDVKEGFKSIDLDGDNHITLEEVSNTPPPPVKITQPNKQNLTLKKKQLLNYIWLKLFLRKGKKVKKNFKK